jgi:hypothetical protein
LNTHPLPTLEELPLVYDFLDVFPKELPGMPLDRTVEFVVKLERRTTHISKCPYKMGPSKLAELKKQLKELEEKGFIRPSLSLCRCPSRFVKENNGIDQLCIDYRPLNQ